MFQSSLLKLMLAVHDVIAMLSIFRCNFVLKTSYSGLIVLALLSWSIAGGMYIPTLPNLITFALGAQVWLRFSAPPPAPLAPGVVLLQNGGTFEDIFHYTFTWDLARPLLGRPCMRPCC